MTISRYEAICRSRGVLTRFGASGAFAGNCGQLPVVLVLDANLTCETAASPYLSRATLLRSLGEVRR